MQRDLAQYMTIKQAAGELELSENSIRRMISDDENPLASVEATVEEQALLLSTGRIKAVPGTGIRLIHLDDIAKAKSRQKRGRPKTKLR